jgi:tetratricopeptide (TPR) repeat protein
MSGVVVWIEGAAPSAVHALSVQTGSTEFPGKTYMKSISDKHQLAQLAIELKLIDNRGLSDSLTISRDTGMPVGRVLVMSGLINETDLNNLVRCQTLLKEGMIDLDMAHKAMVQARAKSMPFEQSLYAIGWSPPEQEGAHPLGQLLVEAGLIHQDQLTSALKHKDKIGLPLGRVLVLNGLVTEGLITAAINAQILMRDKKLKKRQAIDALREASRRSVPLESLLQAKGFYEMPSRSSPRLGELLTMSGLLSDSELISALESGLASQKPLGEVLISQKLVSPEVVDAALLMQTAIAQGTLRLDQARTVLLMVNHGTAWADALKSVVDSPTKKEKPVERMPFLTFLEKLKQVDAAGFASALEIAKGNTSIVMQILTVGQLADEESLERAEECYKLASAGKLTIEHACLVFDYAKRNGVSTQDALRELHWQFGDNSTKQNLKALKKKDDKQMATSQMSLLTENAAHLTKRGDFAGARRIYERISAELERRNDKNYVYCLDALAQTCISAKDFPAAEEYYLESFRLKKVQFGEDSFEAALAVENLGKLYHLQQRSEDALKYAKEYIQMCGKIFGADHPNVACGWHNVASVHYKSGDLAQAVRAYQIALNICRRHLGEQHPTTIRIEKNLATAQKQMEGKVRDLGSITGSWRVISVDNELKLKPEE